MRVWLARTIALASLSLTVPAAAARPAEDYFYVREKQDVVTQFTEQDVRTQPGTFEAKKLELRGYVIGHTNEAVVLKTADRGEYTVQLLPGKQVNDYPSIGVNYTVRMLCNVFKDEASATGGLELVIAVKENDAKALEAERERVKAATAQRAKTTPKKLSSRGASTTVARAAKKYNAQETLGKYTAAVRYFNRGLTQANAERIASSIISYSLRYGLDARLVMAVVACESNFNPNAVSPMGARGLGQLMPGTAGDLGVGNSFNIEQNLEGSTRLLKTHINSFSGGKVKNAGANGEPTEAAIKLALACYNAGAGAVRKYKGIPPYQETVTYIARITRLYRQFCGKPT